MSATPGKASIRRYTEEVWNKGNLAMVDKTIAPDYVFHGTPEAKGPEGAKQMVTAFRTAMPDYHLTIDHIFIEGDFVAVFVTAHGTFTGEVAGVNVKPTGKKLALSSVALTRYRGGKAVEGWVYADSLEMLRQLGIPIPQQ